MFLILFFIKFFKFTGLFFYSQKIPLPVRQKP
ncbi:hypothetical protein EcB171_3144, partial [Escherichia coli B171]